MEVNMVCFGATYLTEKSSCIVYKFMCMLYDNSILFLPGLEHQRHLRKIMLLGM